MFKITFLNGPMHKLLISSIFFPFGKIHALIGLVNNYLNRSLIWHNWNIIYEKLCTYYVSWDVGIQPNGAFYSLANIREAIQNGIGYTPWIECNVDTSGNSQLYQVYLCVNTSASNLIECPVFPNGKCGSQIEFPSF